MRTRRTRQVQVCTGRPGLAPAIAPSSAHKSSQRQQRLLLPHSALLTFSCSILTKASLRKPAAWSISTGLSRASALPAAVATAAALPFAPPACALGMGPVAQWGPLRKWPRWRSLEWVRRGGSKCEPTGTRLRLWEHPGGTHGVLVQVSGVLLQGSTVSVMLVPELVLH